MRTSADHSPPLQLPVSSDYKLELLSLPALARRETAMSVQSGNVQLSTWRSCRTPAGSYDFQLLPCWSADSVYEVLREPSLPSEQSWQRLIAAHWGHR